MREIEIVSKKKIEIPIEILENYPIAPKVNLVVLIYICAYSKENIDISEISKMTNYDEEDVSDAISFWTKLGVIQDKKKSLEELINDKLKLVLGRPPQTYEIEFIKKAYEKTGLEDESVLSGVLDLCYSRERSDLKWAVQILEKCAQSPTPKQTLELFVKYYSLTNRIKEDFNLDRDLTSRERKIILEWANKRIPIYLIFEAFANCQRYLNGKISFPFMDTTLNRLIEEEKSDLIIGNNDLGY